MAEQKDISDWAFNTRAVRAGLAPTNEGEHSTPIFTTSSFLFDSAEQAEARFSGDEPGNIYSRFTNPSVRVFEDRLTALENGAWCQGTASGMAAVTGLCLAVLQQGDHLVASRSIFGTINVLFDSILPRYGIEVSFVDLADVADWQAAIKDNTKLLFLETPSNPQTAIGDLRAIADIAHQAGAELAVDNCFCTPALQRPFEFGADYVIHSATKYLDGQGRCIGGAILGNKPEQEETIRKFVRTTGPTMSPFNAWVFTKGLEILSLRMKGHCENAQKVAEFLNTQPNVKQVFYPGLSSHPQHELAKSQQSGFGAIVSFEVEGGREAAWKIINNTSMLSITANLGDTRTTITHPATTTHGRVSDEEKAKAGVTEGLIRIAVGLEDADDIIADIVRGLA
jgi:O-succinylhomoserine sulfhydrylase